MDKGSYKQYEVKRDGIKVTVEIPECAVDEERIRKEVKKILTMLLHEQLREA